MDFVLHNESRFPVGTTVKAYKASNWGTGKLPPAGAPIGASVAEAVVAADGTATLKGLEEGVRYYAAGEVASAWRYSGFLTKVAEGEGGGGGGSEEAVGTVTPEEHGAKGDLKFVLDAGIAAAAKVLTSATAAFTAADVGKTVSIRGAGLNENKNVLTTTIAAFTDATHVELTAAAAVTVANAVAVYGTDDTVALKEAVAAAFTAGVANGSYFGQVALNGRYMVAGATTKGGATKGNAQIPLPYNAPASTKFVLTLKCPGRGAPLLHWHQKAPQITAGTIFSPLVAAAADGEWSVPSVIGGPTVLAEDEGTDGFSNMLFEIQGALTILMPRHFNHMALDLGLVGQADIDALAILPNSTATEVKNDAGANEFSANGEGVRMPKIHNNDKSLIRSLSVEGATYALGGGEHLTVGSLATIYCKVPLFIGPLGGVAVHGALIGYWSAEGGRSIIEVNGNAGGKYPITVQRLDVEDGPGVSTDFIDAANCLRGPLQWANDASRAPTKTGAEHLKVTDNDNTA